VTSLEELYRTHAGRVRRAVHGAVRGVGADMVEDACQDAWPEMIRNLDRIQAGEDRQLYAYVVTTAIRRGRKLARRERRTTAMEAELPNGLDVAERVVVHEWLQLARASERQRRMLWLHALGFSYAEIAQATGGSTRTVDRQLQRGRRRLGA
jgi:RNA polymerase sigma factor (sigma-70 family)